MKRKFIFFRPSEIQSGSTRIKHAEGLIEQLPQTHDGRNTWLLNYGKGTEAKQLRKNRSLKMEYCFMSDSYL